MPEIKKMLAARASALDDGVSEEAFTKQETAYMKQAIRQAQKTGASGDVPIGCVIVYDGLSPESRAGAQAAQRGIKAGTVIGRGYNRRNADGSALQHAEIIAIKKACKKLGDWRLEDCTLYVTLEPCPMCAGAIVQARIPRVVMGCMNEKAGCCGSVLDLLHQERLNHRAQVRVGLCGEACSALMRDFFAQLREKKKQEKQKKKQEMQGDGS